MVHRPDNAKSGNLKFPGKAPATLVVGGSPIARCAEAWRVHAAQAVNMLSILVMAVVLFAPGVLDARGFEIKDAAKVPPGRTGAPAPKVRHGSPRLQAELNAVLARYPKGSWQRNAIGHRYVDRPNWTKARTYREDLARFDRTVHLFRKYGDRYDVAYPLLMAQGSQESGLNQAARSRVGAIGIMQVMPATGKAMEVGDITRIEPNIHAGVKFLRTTMDRYYANEPMTRLDKKLFSVAAYNAGPGRIRQWRRRAAQRGLDPNVWFNNVERLAAETPRQETVTYVSNVYEDYLAYKTLEKMARRREEGQGTGGAPHGPVE